jgi:hypothetical protein
MRIPLPGLAPGHPSPTLQSAAGTGFVIVDGDSAGIFQHRNRAAETHTVFFHVGFQFLRVPDNRHASVYIDMHSANCGPVSLLSHPRADGGADGALISNGWFELLHRNQAVDSSHLAGVSHEQKYCLVRLRIFASHRVHLIECDRRDPLLKGFEIVQ